MKHFKHDKQEKQVTLELKQRAKTPGVNPTKDSALKALAKQLVAVRQQREKLYAAKAHIGAVGMHASSMASQVAAASFSHFFMNEFLAAPASFLSVAEAVQLGPSAIADKGISASEDRGALARMIMTLLDHWKLGTEDQAALLGIARADIAEAARLLGSDAHDVQRDRYSAAHALVQRFNAVVVLKGAGTVVAAPGSTPRVVGAGNPGMAVGGMGDVLTGVVASLRAQGLSAFDAASLGALLHAVAGDAAAAVAGPIGLLPSDLMPEWFAGAGRVGLTAGASAPDILVQQVIARLKALGALSVRRMAGVEETVHFPLPKGLGDKSMREFSASRS